MIWKCVDMGYLNVTSGLLKAVYLLRRKIREGRGFKTRFFFTVK